MLKNIIHNARVIHRNPLRSYGAGTVAPAADDGLVHIQLTPRSHELLSRILLAGVAKLSGAERAEVRRLAGVCKVDGDKLWGDA